MASEIIIHGNLKELYKDVYTPEALSALSFLSHFNNDIKALMNARLKRRAERQQKKQRIAFLDPESLFREPTSKLRMLVKGSLKDRSSPTTCNGNGYRALAQQQNQMRLSKAVSGM